MGGFHKSAIYSSSPQNTFTPFGSHASSQTLNLSGRESITFISSSVRSQPSSSKFASILALLTDLGITDHPCLIPHTKRTCCTVFAFWSAICLSLSFLYRGELVLPRQE